MANNSRIEWTETTWNPLTGCTKISPGCKFCYAEVMARRLKAMGSPRYQNGFKLTLQPDLLDQPKYWKRPRKIFVNSMSDLFHDDVPTDFIVSVFEAMREAKQHTYQVLTKRPDRLVAIQDQLSLAAHIWLGTSVESAGYKFRIDLLREVRAPIRFISFEPLLGDVGEIDLKKIGWVIVGGESGAKARPIERAWVRKIFRQCREQDVAFFFKQWGGKNKKKAGRTLNGRIYSEYPCAL